MFLKNLSHNDSEPYMVDDFLTLGSSKENSITIPESMVCEKHARIEKKEDAYIIRDLRSKHGTFVNGFRVLEAYLELGDVVKIGEQEFILEKNETETPFIPTSHNLIWSEHLKNIPNVAKTELPILLLGPSGTGKELLAQYVHDCSMRRRRPIVKVNCSALTESLAESELFGHTKGAFTGASQDRKGAFEAARTGTLVLDEVGDLPLNIQPKLLRALENREIKPVGSDQVLRTNVRIIASTHQNLKEKVEKGEFRKDLFFRLNVVQIQVPSLQERMEDFEKILFEFAKEYKVRFSYTAIESLKNHVWPGNIRELKNTVSRASILKNRKNIELEDLAKIIDTPLNEGVHSKESYFSFPRTPKTNLIKEIEKQMIQQRLIINRGNQKKTADDLGIPKSTLHDRIKYYKINIDLLLQDDYMSIG